MDITGITWFISLFKSLYKIIIWPINAFTGRGNFQKAKRMYEELQTHYSKKKMSTNEKQMSCLIKSIYISNPLMNLRLI